MDKGLLFVILYWLVLGVLLGWIIPIKGPFDSGKDEEANMCTQKQKPKQVGVASPKKSSIVEVLIDLNNDETPEWYLLVPEGDY